MSGREGHGEEGSAEGKRLNAHAVVIAIRATEEGTRLSIEHHERAGRYRIGAELGSGAMGAVYRAYDRLTGQEVALKQVSLPLGLAPAEVEQELLTLAHEFGTLAGLRHPNIISVFDYGFDAARRPFFTTARATRATPRRRGRADGARLGRCRADPLSERAGAPGPDDGRSRLARDRHAATEAFVAQAWVAPPRAALESQLRSDLIAAKGALGERLAPDAAVARALKAL